MNALGASILAVILVTVLFAPRRWALVGMTAGILYLTQRQQVDVGGVNLYALRFVELAGFARVVLLREFSLDRLGTLDRVLIALHVYTFSIFALRSNEPKTYELGMAVDALLSYLTFRALIDGAETLRWFLKALTVLVVPYGVLVAYETITFRNPFAAIGGVEMALGGDTWVRAGRLRAVGSFGHPSLMGTFGGAFLPLFIGLWFGARERVVAVTGAVACLALVWASNSGGPATCVAFALVGWMCWPLRRNMRVVRWALVSVFGVLALLMNAPVWYLLAKLGNLIGGDGWHRAELLNVAFQNVRAWGLAGMPMIETAGWLPYTNNVTGAVDMTNHFLVFGITAGLGSVFLLIYLLVEGYRHVGRALSVARTMNDRSMEYLYWAVGVTLTVHIGNWFAITYWDQTNLVWFMHLGLVGSLTVEAMQRTATHPALAVPAVKRTATPRRSTAPSPSEGQAPRSPIRGATFGEKVSRSRIRTAGGR
jgi:hypothetical protein